MKSFIRIIFFLIALAVASATCATYFSSYIEPDKLRYIVFSQYVFPYLWLMNAGIILIYLFLGRSWRIAIPLTAAVLTISGALSVFAIYGESDTPSDKQSIKVLTYNLHYMSLSSPDTIGAFLSQQDADIVCFQEADENVRKKLAPFVKAYPYVLVHRSDRTLNPSGDRQLLYSKYPLKDVSNEATKDFLQWAEVEVGNRKLTIFNCHLASIGLVKDEITVFDPNKLQGLPSQDRSNVKKQLSTTRDKMLGAYHTRQEQILSIVGLIHTVNQPLLVCGDFNDTPISYSYQMMRKQSMKDSFMEAGRGLGNTYNGDLPPIRIDYIWHSEDMEAVKYKELRVPYSDHFPATATLTFLD